MSPLDRRRMIIVTALAAPAMVGCGNVDDAIENADTETLETGRIVLRGFAIVAYIAGTRIVTLPTPGVRILGVALIVTSLSTKLAIEYLDVELNKRYVTEDLSQDEAKQIETDLAVTFKLENGDTEQVVLGPNQYETDDKVG